MLKYRTFASNQRYTKILGVVAVALFVAAVPLFLVTSNLRWVIGTPLLYSYGFDKYDIVERTGYVSPRFQRIERDELMSAARQIRDYFNNGDESITIRVVQGGVRVQNLFNPIEVLHMKDVKGLVKGVYRIQMVTGVYLLGFAVLALAIRRRSFLPRLARYVGFGGGLTIGLLVLIGLGALVGFERLFLAFHQISFSNDFWQLNPGTDFLIAMFPEGLFFDATMWVAASTIVEALLLAGVPLTLLWWRPRIERRAAQRLAT